MAKDTARARGADGLAGLPHACPALTKGGRDRAEEEEEKEEERERVRFLIGLRISFAFSLSTGAAAARALTGQFARSWQISRR